MATKLSRILRYLRSHPDVTIRVRTGVLKDTQLKDIGENAREDKPSEALAGSQRSTQDPQGS